jgi:hypothetical protein
MIDLGFWTIVAAVAAVVSPVAIILGGLVVGVPSAVLAHRRRPKLVLDFDGAEGRGFVVEQDWWEGEPKKHLEFLTILVCVRNEGKTVATNCRVLLTDLKKVIQGTPSQTRFAMSRQLSWPGWEFDPRPLYPEVRLLAELVGVDKSSSGWFFHFKGITQYEKPLEQDFQATTYRFYVMAVADNAAPYRIEIDVTYSGNWKTLAAKRV